MSARAHTAPASLTVLVCSLGIALLLLGPLAGNQALAQGATTRTPVPTAAAERDWALPGGHYFTQAGGGAGGFAIGDDNGIALWTAYRTLGGAPALGYPASRRFTMDGFVYQATQAALLQWRPDGTITLGNTFELLGTAGKDAWLRDTKGIPAPVADDGSTGFDDAVRIRMGWLTDGAIRDRYLAPPEGASGPWSERDAIQLYGLPMSRPERSGPFIAQRFQRVAFQRWVDAVPGMPPPGAVTAVLGGDLLKEAGVIGGLAATPHSAAALVNRPVALGAAAPSPTPALNLPHSPTPAPPRQTTPAAITPRAGSDVNVTQRAGGTAALRVEGTLSEYAISLDAVSARVGQVRFALSNTGTLRHNLHILGPGTDKKSADLRPGQSEQLDITFGETGTYQLYCDLADHEALGMTATFTVAP